MPEQTQPGAAYPGATLGINSTSNNSSTDDEEDSRDGRTAAAVIAAMLLCAALFGGRRWHLRRQEQAKQTEAAALELADNVVTGMIMNPLRPESRAASTGDVIYTASTVETTAITANPASTLSTPLPVYAAVTKKKKPHERQQQQRSPRRLQHFSNPAKPVLDVQLTPNEIYEHGADGASAGQQLYSVYSPPQQEPWAAQGTARLPTIDRPSPASHTYVNHSILGGQSDYESYSAPPPTTQRGAAAAAVIYAVPMEDFEERADCRPASSTHDLSNALGNNVYDAGVKPPRLKAGSNVFDAGNGGGGDYYDADPAPSAESATYATVLDDDDVNREARNQPNLGRAYGGSKA